MCCRNWLALYHEGVLSDRKWELQSTGADDNHDSVASWVQAEGCCCCARLEIGRAAARWGWSSRYEAQKTASAHSGSHDRRGGRHVAAVTFTTTAMGRIAVISCPWEELGAGSSLVIINVTLLTFLGSLGPHLGVPSDLMSAFALPLDTFSSRNGG